MKSKSHYLIKWIGLVILLLATIIISGNLIEKSNEKSYQEGVVDGFTGSLDMIIMQSGNCSVVTIDRNGKTFRYIELECIPEMVEYE